MKQIIIFLIAISVLSCNKLEKTDQQKIIDSLNLVNKKITDSLQEQLKEKEKQALEKKEQELNIKDSLINVKQNILNEQIDLSDEREEARSMVKNWLNDFNNRDYRSAYSKLLGEKWGTYYYFDSYSSYGGVTKTVLNSSKVIQISKTEAQVSADYEAHDWYNGDGRYKEIFYLKKIEGKWYITRIKRLKQTRY